MDTIIKEGSFKLVIHLPAVSGLFHFALLRKAPGVEVIDLGAAAIPALYPELRDYVGLHNCYQDGTPKNVHMDAWFHIGGIIAPAEDFASRAAPAVCLDRLARLLRIPRDRAERIVSRLEDLQNEGGNLSATHADMVGLIEELRDQWQREAAMAIVSLRAMFPGEPLP